MGFCLYNNVAVAVNALRAKGAKKIAIVDWDVHHGNYHVAIRVDGSCISLVVVVVAAIVGVYSILNICYFDEMCTVVNYILGNGTQDIFEDCPDVLFFSLHRYGNGFYPGRAQIFEC